MPLIKLSWVPIFPATGVYKIALLGIFIPTKTSSDFIKKKYILEKAPPSSLFYKTKKNCGLGLFVEILDMTSLVADNNDKRQVHCVQ